MTDNADINVAYFPGFWEHVILPPGSDCWLWDKPNRQGYGHIERGGVKWWAHRLSYEAHVGPIPTGLYIDHLCRNRACVNPAHLEPVTNAENVRRGERGARTTCAHGHALDDAFVYRHHGPSGGTRRVCRVCNRLRARRHYAKVHGLPIPSMDDH